MQAIQETTFNSGDKKATALAKDMLHGIKRCEKDTFLDSIL